MKSGLFLTRKLHKFLQLQSDSHLCHTHFTHGEHFSVLVTTLGVSMGTA